MAATIIGTSGWNYKHWRGAFYPAGLRQRDELAYLADQLDSVELNGTFYSLQRPDSFRAWRNQTPDPHIRRLIGMGADKVIPEIAAVSEQSALGQSITDRKKQAFAALLPALQPSPTFSLNGRRRTMPRPRSPRLTSSMLRWRRSMRTER